MTAHICDTIPAGCAHALECSQFVHSCWGTRVGGFRDGWGELAYAEHLSLSVGGYFKQKKR